MKDRILGELTFNVGWCKIENINLWSKDYNIKIRFSAYENQAPNEVQKSQYIDFKKNLNTISEKSEIIINKFITEQITYIRDLLGNEFSSDFQKILTPVQVLFLQSGKRALLLKPTWIDEDVVIVLEDDLSIDYGEQIEGEV